MNEYGFIDYRKPGTGKNDYRTSTYRGSIHLIEQIPPRAAGNLRNICKRFPRDINKEEILKSEIQEQYTCMPTDPTNVRNPAVKGMKFIKPYEESKLRFVPKPLRPHSSIYKQDYKCKSRVYEEEPPVLKMQNAVENTRPLLIIRGKPGYAKYLDPSSTTSNLDYVQYVTPQLNLAANDNITFWNWEKEKKNVFKIKEHMCNLFRSSECPKRHAEFTTQVKCVPNRGLTSESKSSYVQILNCLNFDITHIKNKLLTAPQEPMRAVSESKIYGSGKRVEKYVG